MIVNGIPNKVYSQKMETKDMSEEVFIRFGKENSLDLLRMQTSLGQGQQSGLSGLWHEVPHSPPLKELADGEKKHNWFEELNMKTMGDYHDPCLKTDVLLLVLEDQKDS